MKCVKILRSRIAQLRSSHHKWNTTDPPSKQKRNNFFDILLPLAKWNMIICLLRTFLENVQNFPFSSLSLHCPCMSVGNSVFFFFKPAAPMHFLFFEVARSPFKQKYGIEKTTGFSRCEVSESYQFLVPYFCLNGKRAALKNKTYMVKLACKKEDRIAHH